MKTDIEQVRDLFEKIGKLARILDKLYIDPLLEEITTATKSTLTLLDGKVLVDREEWNTLQELSWYLRMLLLQEGETTITEATQLEYEPRSSIQIEKVIHNFTGDKGIRLAYIRREGERSDNEQ